MCKKQDIETLSNFLHLKKGLREIVEDYDVFCIDLWGVVHNGVSLNSPAIKVLDNLKNF